MIGLKYTCVISDIKLKEIGEELGVSKQTVNSWVSGSRKIPDIYLDELSQKFNLRKELLQKEINEIDKLNIQNIILKQQIENVSVISKDEEGFEYESIIEDPYGIREDIRLNKIKIKGLENLEVVKKQLIGEKDKLDSNYREEIENLVVRNEIFEDLASILNNSQVELKLIRRILKSLLDVYGIKSKSEANWDFDVDYYIEDNNFDTKLKDLLKSRNL